MVTEVSETLRDYSDDDNQESITKRVAPMEENGKSQTLTKRTGSEDG